MLLHKRQNTNEIKVTTEIKDQSENTESPPEINNNTQANISANKQPTPNNQWTIAAGKNTNKEEKATMPTPAHMNRHQMLQDDNH